MLYLKNTTAEQTILIPRSDRSVVGTMTFRMESTTDKTIGAECVATDNNKFRIYYAFPANLNGGIADGEYKFRLEDAAGVLAVGLAIVSGGESSGIQYNKDIEYKQYGK